MQIIKEILSLTNINSLSLNRKRKALIHLEEIKEIIKNNNNLDDAYNKIIKKIKQLESNKENKEILVLISKEVNKIFSEINRIKKLYKKKDSSKEINDTYNFLLNKNKYLKPSHFENFYFKKEPETDENYMDIDDDLYIDEEELEDTY